MGEVTFSNKLRSKGVVILAAAVVLSSCTTDVAVFEEKSRTEIIKQDVAPHVAVMFVWDDSPMSKILQGFGTSPNSFDDYLQSFTNAIANPTFPARVSVQIGGGSAAYTGWYGSEAFPDSARTLDVPIRNFNQAGRITDASLIFNNFKSRLNSRPVGAPIQQYMGSLFRILEYNDPKGVHAPFPADYSGSAPDAYVVTFVTLSEDATPDEAPSAANPSIFLPTPQLRLPMLQNSLEHILRYSIEDRPVHGVFSPCLQAWSTDPACVCPLRFDPGQTPELTCLYWHYRFQYPRLSKSVAKERLNAYFRNISGGSNPNVVYAALGLQTLGNVVGLSGTAVMVGYYRYLHESVIDFNSGNSFLAQTNVCANNGGLDGQCSWTIADPAGFQSVFGLAETLANNTIKPIILKREVDLERPITVVVSTAAGNRTLLPSEYTVAGNQITLAQTIIALIAANRLTPPYPEVVVTYFGKKQ